MIVEMSSSGLLLLLLLLRRWGPARCDIQLCVRGTEPLARHYRWSHRDAVTTAVTNSRRPSSVRIWCRGYARHVLVTWLTLLLLLLAPAEISDIISLVLSSTLLNIDANEPLWHIPHRDRIWGFVTGQSCELPILQRNDICLVRMTLRHLLLLLLLMISA